MRRIYSKWMVWLVLIILPAMLSADMLPGKDFTIQYEPKDRKTAEFIAERAGIFRLEIRNKLGLDMTPFQIILTARERDFKEASGKDFPHWGVAAAQYRGRKILLKSPRFSRQSFPELSATLHHEMIHLALEPIDRLTYLPRWLNEGLAQHEAEQFDLRQKVLLGQAALYGKFMDLHKIDDVLKFEQNRANLAYAQSVSAVRYLISEHGYESIGELLILLQEGVEWSRAFEIVYGYEPRYYSTNWELWAIKRYKAYALVDLHTLLWGILPVLLLMAWFQMRRRNARIHHTWQTEEILKNPDLPPHDDKKDVNSHDA
ncbi:peptidase MA family metallohydrolase [Fidelibacter multiformis]|uniref:peptidase MA family metallohydrolase n=1 Tax=Fidelibacter multiformis TaxID=3377529 RepID=UPI0037DC6F68